MIDRRASGDRIVKPRKPATNADRPIIVVIDDTYCRENGTTGTLSAFIKLLRREPLTTVIYAGESVALLRKVQDHWGANPNFQFRVTPVEREVFTGKDTGRRIVLTLTSVGFFGWCNEKRGRANSVRNRYHLLLDPLTFSNHWLEERTFQCYMEWAQALREFCIAQQINLRPTQGSVARQFLQDPRFYPDARRKVPRATNDRVREQLPGNQYELTVSPDPTREYEGEYLDQTKCHHYHAIRAQLPCSNSLYGRGHFRHPTAAKSYRRTPERIDSFMEGFCGLYLGTLWWPIALRDTQSFVPSYLKHYGTEQQPANEPVYFYSEDVPLLESLGVRVTRIIAAWGSKKPDTGLAKYAQWALEELGEHPPAWKKTLLLAPYGALAITARKAAYGYHQSKGGRQVAMRTKHGTELPVKLHEASKVAEPSTNNVLHRALIEASNRTETLLYANYLQSEGFKVLCIYVDAVLVESAEALPVLIAPWRHESHLTRLRFLSPSQFTSEQMARLPGITGAERRSILRGSYKGAKRLGSRSEQRIRAAEAFLALDKRKAS